MKRLMSRLKKADHDFFKATKKLTKNLTKSMSRTKEISLLYRMKQEASLWAAILKFLDIPSGSILGLFTLQVWIMMWIAFFTSYDIKASILTAYGSVLAGFTVHGVTKMVTNKGAEGE